MNEDHMTLLRDWNGRTDLTGWLWSEKLDGCRAFWDGFNLWTRGGKKIKAPKDFIAQLPSGFRLDGELWAGRERFEEASIATRLGKFTRRIQFKVFDAPSETGSWSERLRAATIALGRATIVSVVKFGIIRDFEDLQIRFFKVWGNGGEGLVLRNPTITTYETGRSTNAIRIKKDPYWGY